jgi:uncharacterized protein YbjT (DUF2867 family)
MRAALAGADAMFLYPGYQDMAATLAEARQAGVRHVAMLSGSSAASGDMTNAISRYMIESETAVRESGLAWTMIRSFGFMSNTLQWVPQLQAGDLVRAPFAGVPVAARPSPRSACPPVPALPSLARALPQLSHGFG